MEIIVDTIEELPDGGCNISFTLDEEATRAMVSYGLRCAIINAVVATESELTAQDFTHE